MKKSIFYKLKSVQEYCCTFSWRFYNCSKLVVPFVFLFSLFAGVELQAQVLRGVVPVQIPANGSGVDGDAFANYKQLPSIYGTVGDLFCKTQYPGPGGCVLDAGGVPITPLLTFFLRDPFDIDPNGTGDPTVFDTSTKINEDPNVYKWKAGSSPNKNDINNCGAHFSYGNGVANAGVVEVLPNGPNVSFTSQTDELWCLFAGDRQVTNGDSYIDFEFLQKPMWAYYGTATDTPIVGPITSGSGGFKSLGTDGGRTQGDVLVTIAFAQGGGAAQIVIQVWTPVSGGFKWVTQNNADFAKLIFITQNTEVTKVPFPVFGVVDNNNEGTYAINQWAEGAINLTKVIEKLNGGTASPCFNLSTLFIRTKTSTTDTAQLKDFPGPPIQLNLDLRKLKIECPADPKLAECSTPTAIETAYLAWKNGFKNSEGVDPVVTNIGDIPKLTDLPACGGQLSFEYKVTDFCHKDPLTCTSTFTVAKDVTIPVITAPADYTLTGCNTDWPASVSATWTDNCGIKGAKSGNVAGVAGTVQTGADGCSQYRDYTFDITDDCTNAAVQKKVRITRQYDVTIPVITAPADYTLTGCNTDWPASVSATWTDNCGVKGAKSGNVAGVAGTVQTGADGCSQYRDYTFDITDDCANVAVQKKVRITRQYDVTIPVITAPADYTLTGCNTDWPASVSATWTDNCGVKGAKSGNVAGVAGTVQTGADGCSQYRD
ncbi:hypothetical protein ACNQGG_11150, partial [Flavobacterium sp. LB1P62]